MWRFTLEFGAILLSPSFGGFEVTRPALLTMTARFSITASTLARRIMVGDSRWLALGQ
jgi:hypothetical protein